MARAATGDTFIAAGRRRHRVTVQNPGTPVPDGDGGYITVPIVSPIPWNVAIDIATARDLEHVTAGTAIATVSHIVTGPYRPDVNSHSSLVYNGRVLNCTAVTNPEERNITLVCVCVEVEEPPATAPPAVTIAVDAAPDANAPVPMPSAWQNF